MSFFKKIFNISNLDIADGIVISVAAILAILFKNTQYGYLYDSIINLDMKIIIGEWSLAKPLLLWINDGLMAIFFLFVTLEIKREILKGELSKKGQVILPFMAAIGGVLMPALIYYGFNYKIALNLKGWAIPVATDIAFALAIITLLKKIVPPSLRITLISIAIIDDIVAISIIALFYSTALSTIAIVAGVICIFAILLLNYLKVNLLSLYVFVGIILWFCVLKSGVHATLAGVILGALIPINIKNKNGEFLLQKLEKDLHPWVAFGVLPVFAFANAGVALTGISVNFLYDDIVQGIVFGLFVGAPLGVIIMTMILVKLNISSLPKGANWINYTGMAMLTGIGFTMSLFIGALAFESYEVQNVVRLSVLLGSSLSTILGVGTLLVNSFLNRRGLI